MTDLVDPIEVLLDWYKQPEALAALYGKLPPEALAKKMTTAEVMHGYIRQNLDPDPLYGEKMCAYLHKRFPDPDQASAVLTAMSALPYDFLTFCVGITVGSMAQCELPLAKNASYPLD